MMFWETLSVHAMTTERKGEHRNHMAAAGSPRRQEAGFLTFSAVAGVKSSLLRPGAAADAKQPGQDDKREKHGRESQGDLL